MLGASRVLSSSRRVKGSGVACRRGGAEAAGRRETVLDIRSLHASGLTDLYDLARFGCTLPDAPVLNLRFSLWSSLARPLPACPAGEGVRRLAAACLNCFTCRTSRQGPN